MLRKKKVRGTLAIIWILIVLQSVNTTPVAGASLYDEGAQVEMEVHSLTPLSIQMVDNAIAVLSKGWSGLSPDERDQFNLIFDPGNTGEIDDNFVEIALDNYQKIRRALEQERDIMYVTESHMCNLTRLYYTDFLKIYICPYFTAEDKISRKVRVMVHEMAHIALLVVDRPYYDPKSYSTRYNALTPRGSWTTRIPVIGPIFREIAHNDTLYHPDAYAWFAYELISNEIETPLSP